jgi:hypothetical protein
MAKAKKSSLDALADVPLHKLVVHPLCLFLFATIAVVGLGNWLWRANQGQLRDRAEFALTLDRLSATSQPEWIRSDLRRTAFDGSRLGEVNLLDADAVSRIARAFAVQSWVAQVAVRKRAAGVQVDLKYRQPVGLVEFGNNLLLPIDRVGTVLDGNDFDLDASPRFLRITVRSPVIDSLVGGHVWPDARVVAAAMVADKIRLRTSAWGVVRIKHLPMTPESTEPGGDFELLSNRGEGGTTVLWGSPPGFERPNESSADQKIALLEEFVTQQGSLERIGTSQTIDLRYGRIRLAARAPDAGAPVDSNTSSLTSH